MIPNDDSQLVQRLEAAEAGLAAARTEIWALQRRSNDGGRRSINGLALVAVGLVIAIGQSALPRAQAKHVGLVQTPFSVVDSQGRRVMTVSEKPFRGVEVFDTEGKSVGAFTADGGGALELRAGTENSAVFLSTHRGLGPAIRLRGIDGKDLAEIASTAAILNSPLRVTSDQKPVVEIRKDAMLVNTAMTIADALGRPVMKVSDAAGAAGRGITLHDTQNQRVAEMIVSPSGKGTVMALDGKRVAGIGFSAAGDGHLILDGADGKVIAEIKKDATQINTQVVVGDGTSQPVFKVQAKGAEGRGAFLFNDAGKLTASVAGDQTGGLVRVFNASGSAVGGLFASGSGGGLALTGASGGKSAVSLSVEPAGGRVRVFPAGGGPAQAELTADAAGGGVTLYTKSGAPAAVLYARTTGAGQLEINQDGVKLVEAGVSANGVGLVLTGPGGVAASMPGVPDSYIIGRKGKQ